MNKSLWSLIILFIIIIMFTSLFMVNYSIPRKNDEKLLLQPFRISRKNQQLSFQESLEELKKEDSLVSGNDIEEMIHNALTNIEVNRIAEAENNVRTALVFDPGNIKGLTILGRILFAQKRYIESEAVFRRQLKIEPDNATALNNLGSSLARQDKIHEALNYVLQAYEKSHDSPEIVLNLAGLYSMTKNIEGAVSMLREAYRIIGSALIPLSKDKSFNNIRNNPRFIKLIDEAKTNILKKKP